MDKFKRLSEQLKSLTDAPEKFVEPGALTSDLKSCLKSFYDFAISDKLLQGKNALPELIIKDFDDEQIWQELELLTGEELPSCIYQISRDVVKKERLTFPVKFKDDEGLEEEECEEEFLEEEEEDEGEDPDQEIDEPEQFSTKPKIKPSVVDDKFFKLSEMEKFLLREEENEGKETEDGDLFFQSEDDSSEAEDDESGFKYSDFFEEPNIGQVSSKKAQLDKDDEEEDSAFSEDEEEQEVEGGRKVRFDLSESSDSGGSDDDDDDDKPKSTFELRQSKLKEKISELEEQALQKKPWQLMGEVSADTRPVNSLLEEVVEFDMTQRPAPLITEETSQRLEDIILRRIKDKAFDDVERKIKPVDTPYEFKKRLVLDQEKSKLSLAEVYEQEFIKQRDNTNPETDKPEQENPEHVEIRKKMNELFKILDALSHFYFTPKPAIPDLKVVNNAPAVTLEEVAPTAMTDANLLAPEEVNKDSKKTLLGKDERTSTDKKRERRKKKALQKKKRLRQEGKEKIKAQTSGEGGKRFDKAAAAVALRKVTKNRNVSVLAPTSGKLKSSSDFFNQLQDKVSTDKSTKLKTKLKAPSGGPSAKKLKL